MKFPQVLLFVLLVTASTTQDAWARTWRVELNGSGNFLDIQPAVDAASAGDTIRIGPGRFQQFHQIVAPAWTAETIVAVTKDNLTFIGAGASQTILGKNFYYAPDGQFPKVICSVDSYDVSISSLAIENMYEGIYWWQGTIEVSNCVFRNCAIGIICWVHDSLIQDCQFEISNSGRALNCELTDALDVSRCSFVGYGQGFVTGASAHNINFADCEFRENTTAMIYDRWSTGMIRNTTIMGSIFAGLMVSYNSQVELSGVTIDGGQYGLIVVDGSVVTGSDVVLQGTSAACLNVASESLVTLNRSHILPASGLGVRTYAYFDSPVVLDLTGIYWGTTDTALIDSIILDSNDDSSNQCTVQYLPIANTQVPTESTTWGDLKALFR